MPESEESKSGETAIGGYCAHCGGEVDEVGNAMSKAAHFEKTDAEPETDQHEATEKMRSAAFAKAMGGRR
jgi:hypothetical protein